jgi:hypothetical protein
VQPLVASCRKLPVAYRFPVSKFLPFCCILLIDNEIMLIANKLSVSYSWRLMEKASGLEEYIQATFLLHELANTWSI